MTVDLGTGDGRYIYHIARRTPERFFIGVEPNAAALGEYSRRVARKPARGGLPNVVYVLAAVEALPPELNGAADRVTAILPWGSLLRALALPDRDALRGVRRLCCPGAALDIVLALHEERDAAEAARLGLPELSERHLTCALPARYRDAGFRIDGVEGMTRDELRALPSTWAKRLAFGRERAVWRVRARAL